MNEAVKAIAEYLTGPDVIEMGMRGNPAALRYFKLRDALGIRGYVKAEEAERIINAKLKEE